MKATEAFTSLHKCQLRENENSPSSCRVLCHCIHRSPRYRGGDVAQLVEHRTVTPLTQVRFPGAAKDFLPRVNFQCRLSYGVRRPPCAIACIYICAHVKDPVVPVRVRWAIETLKHPACTVGWVARLCRSWLSPGKVNPNFQLEKFHWENTVVKNHLRKLAGDWRD